MKRFLSVLPWAIVAALVALGLSSTPRQAEAQSSTSSKVQGLIPGGTGSTAPVGSINPILLGAANVTSLQALRCSSAGDLYIAALTSGSSSTTLLTNAAGALFVVTGAVHPGLDTPIRPTATSNGTSNVTITAVSGTKAVYVGALLFLNAGTVAHTITVSSSAGGVVAVFTIPAGGTGVLGEDGGMFASQNGEGLVFSIDAGGTGTDVTLSGVVYQK